jgi:hypothetical protein
MILALFGKRLRIIILDFVEETHEDIEPYISFSAKREFFL